jgi:hypothetical protein
MVNLHDNHTKILQFFAYEHLRLDLQHISEPFSTLAFWLVDHLPANAERTAAIRKLLEAKDCAVRSALFDEDWCG